MKRRVRVKICGITNGPDADAAVGFGADALGFIFYPGSPRCVTVGSAREIIGSVRAPVLLVGVFVNQPHAFIAETVRQCGLHAIQLSGDELPEECLGFDRPVIKAIRPRNTMEAEAISRYRISAVLVDGYRTGEYGGTGVTADPASARTAGRHFPLILSGGLGPANVAEAVRSTEPFAVDVNSGVEMEPGKKDHGKLQELFAVLNTQSGNGRV